MPLSTLTDPDDLVRAQAALEGAWERIKQIDFHILGSEDVERHRLAVIVAGLAPLCEDEAELVDRAVRRFIA